MAITFIGFAGKSGTLGADPNVDLAAAGITLVQDDYLVAVGRAGGALTNDGSWTTLPGSQGANQPLFGRKWNTGDPTNFTFTTAGAVNSVVVIGVWRGVHTSSPVDDSDGIIGTGAMAVPSVDPAGTGRTLAELAVKLQNTTFTFSGGGELFDATTSTQNFVVAGAQETNIANAPTGTRTATPASGAANGVAYSIVLRPATTQYFKTLTAVMDGTPTIVKKVAKFLTAAMDGNPTLARLVTAHRTLTATMNGIGTIRRKVTKTLTAVMNGTGTIARKVGKSLVATMNGTGSIIRKVAKSLLAVMDGEPTLTRNVTAHRTLETVMDGRATLSKRLSLSQMLQAVMNGSATITKRSVLARSMSAVMNGKPFGYIKLLWGLLPSGDCPADWTPNDGQRSIEGDVFFHEPPDQGEPVVGAEVTLIRDSDGLRITATLTDAAGHYVFPRDTNDPYTYHVEVRYTNQQGLSEGGCAPT